MILTAFHSTWFLGHKLLKSNNYFRSKIKETMSGPSGMGKPAFMPASVRNQQVQQVGLVQYFKF